jgi:hypothetical protein
VGINGSLEGYYIGIENPMFKIKHCKCRIAGTVVKQETGLAGSCIPIASILVIESDLSAKNYEIYIQTLEVSIQKE